MRGPQAIDFEVYGQQLHSRLSVPYGISILEIVDASPFLNLSMCCRKHVLSIIEG